MTTKSGQSKMKDAWAAKALMERHGIETVEELAALLAKLGEPKADVAEASEPPPPEPVVAGKVADDLAWITADTGAVHVVARFTNLVLRPQKPGFNPPIDSISVFENHRGPWEACPFDLSSKNREQEILNWVHYGRWSHIAIPRDVAEVCYSDARWPLPTKAVISGKEFTGWDQFAQSARGTYRDLTDRVPLRESVRRCLQRFPGQVFIDARYHRELKDPRIVNPYGNRLVGLALKLPAVQLEGVTR